MDNSTPFRTFGTMLDCSRNAVPNLNTLKSGSISRQASDTTPCFYTQKTPMRYRTSRTSAICAGAIHKLSCVK